MAIALDTTSSFAWSSGTTASGNHTCTGSDLLLIAGVITVGATGETVNGATYNGVSMTKVGAEITDGSRILTLFALAGPATGSNSLQVTWSAGTFGAANILIASYTGCSQTGIPDAAGNTVAASGTSNTVTVVTSADNCWLVGIAECDGAILSAGTNTTQRVAAASTTRVLYDTNAAQTPAGSKSMQCTWTPSQANRFTAISFAPVSASGPANMKTWDGLATASVKTMDGLAIASVKTWNGLT